ncbi:DUF2291 domain-containing protein [Fibrella sp. HMF5405]|uniref:DUF2291 domain-containing protein n=2 Tax=Fibrella forsythiae TaxID=2817061 RepID=A0ABS3JH94_9BACT|nr:DUF2291 domain-containing protein [Fibrella forsythiae]
MARKPLLPRPLLYAIELALFGFIAYNSLYIRKLSDIKAAGTAAAGAFQAPQYARSFWTSKLLPAAPGMATDLGTLLISLKTDKDKAFAAHSHAMGIGNIRYFLIKGEGTVTATSDNDVTVTLPTGEPIHLATEFVFGNAARDASGLINITEFDNTTDLNNVSAELNDIIRKQVIPGLKASAKPGTKLSFIGALELNQAHLHTNDLTVIPIRTAL